MPKKPQWHLRAFLAAFMSLSANRVHHFNGLRRPCPISDSDLLRTKKPIMDVLCLHVTDRQAALEKKRGGKRIEESVLVFILCCVPLKPDNAILSVWQIASSTVPLMLNSIIPVAWNNFIAISTFNTTSRVWEDVQQARRGLAKGLTHERCAEGRGMFTDGSGRYRMDGCA